MTGRSYKLWLDRLVNSSIDLGFEYSCTNRSLGVNVLRMIEQAQERYEEEGDGRELFLFTCQVYQALERVRGDMDQECLQAIENRLVELWEEVYDNPSKGPSHGELLEGILPLLGEEPSKRNPLAYEFLQEHFKEHEELKKKQSAPS